MLPLVLQAQATKITFRGNIQEKETGTALPGATVLNVLTNTGTVSNINGDFQLETNSDNGSYTIQFSFIGYLPVEKKITTTKRVYNFGVIALEPDVQKINEVVVKGKVPTAIMKSDTISFNAEAVKVSADAKGTKLLKKLPGFTVEKGKIETQGEEVKKVLLNGKPYFEDDPQNALNSLPAEMIQNIELFDDYGEIASFTGYMSGNSTKAINIVTKPMYANSLTGKYKLGLGNNNRYEFEGTSRYASKNHTATLVFDGNNINKSNSGLSDFKSFEQQMAAKLSKGVLDQEEGLGEQEYKSIGVNYNGNFGKKTELSVNYVCGIINSKLNQSTVQNYQDVWFYNINDSIRQKTNLNKLSIKLTHEPSEKNKWIFSQKSLIMNGDKNIFRNTNGQTQNYPVNYSTSSNQNDLNRFNSTSTLIWLHNFDKAGRSLTAIANVDVRSDNQDHLIISETGKYQLISETEMDTLFTNQNERNDIENNNNTAMLRVSYKEPLSMLSSLNFVAKSTYSWREGDKKTYLLDQVSGKYENISNDISNNFQSDYWVNRAEIGFSQLGIRTVFNIGLAYENANINNKQNPIPLNYKKKTYHNILPFVFGKYFISTEQNLIFFARSKPILPSVQQLQETTDISNPLKVVVGNSDLKEGIQHIIMGRYTLAKSKSSKFLSAYAFFKYANDFVGWESYFLKENQNINGYELLEGTQVSKSTNLNGLMQIMAGVDYSLPVKFIKSNLNLGGKYTYGKIPTLYEGIKLNSYSSSYGIKVSLVSNISQNVDFNISSYTAYNHASNNQNDNNTEYISQNIDADLSLTFLRRYNVEAEYLLKTYNYFGKNPAQENHLLNLTVGHSFLKNKKAKLSIKMYDVLNQNKGLAFNLHETYQENIQANALNQYMMVSFQLKL